MPELISTEEKIIFSLPQIKEVAQKLLNAADGLKVWALNAPMGAGKTTLTKAIIEALGSDETVASPTFSIVNEYQTQNEIVYHFDFYRIKSETEAFDIGTEEYFDSGHLCLIEWPEKITSLLPKEYFEVRIEIVNEQTRSIEYHKHG